MIAERLDWDSNHFGFDVYKIVYDSNALKSDLYAMIASIFEKGGKLIYVFSKQKINILPLIQTGMLVDKKVTFLKEININEKEFKEDNIYDYNSLILSNKLIELAKLSGEYSRFFIDNRLSKEAFYRMYEQWIAKSVEGVLADKVFVYKEYDTIQGFVTVKLKTDFSQIGLIAVDNNYQGKGIGQALLKTADQYTTEMRLNKIRVVTQEDNFQAMRFYEKSGFVQESKEYIYHFYNNL